MAGYDTIIAERRGRVLLITLNRPEARNAINERLTEELIAAAVEGDGDPEIGCIVVTGSARFFAAGADIKDMSSADYMQMYQSNKFGIWERFTSIRTPIVAAVSGYALGGGCELAMMCDIILAADTAVFAQPEIKLGVMPGMGGTQRLIRAVGKSLAMELCLTGRTLGASEAKEAGLVSRIVPADDLLATTLDMAETIAAMSTPIAMMTKDAINRSYETTLAEGIRSERSVFHAMFATFDQKEGMSAFIEKRDPTFRHR